LSAQAKSKDERAFSTFQLIVFKQGNEEYGLHIDQIKEVVLTPNVTKMPQTSSYIKGVANIRGNIIAIVDLEEKFGIQKLEAVELNSTNNYTLVVESEDFKIGLLVKEVPNTLTISESNIDETVNIVHNSSVEQNYIKGIVKLEERLIILIDIFKVMSEHEVTNTIHKSAVEAA
jgi:purine-binding chemotaxis protein CheW